MTSPTPTNPGASLSLRDQFAIAALPGILAAYCGTDTGFRLAPFVSSLAYEVAEAMLIEREQAEVFDTLRPSVSIEEGESQKGGTNEND